MNESPFIVVYSVDSDIRIVQIATGADPSSHALLSHVGLVCDLGNKVHIASDGVQGDSSQTLKDEVLERIYIGRRFRNDTERLEKLFEMYTKMTTKASALALPQSGCVLFMRMASPQEAHMNKRATNLTIDPVLLDEARALNINLSATFEASLRDAVRKEKAAKWLEENRAALEGYNAWIEQNGLPLEKYRQF
jgi:antitoxin CcdA